MARLFLLLALALAPFKALAYDLDLIVMRGEGIVELFISTRADNFLRLFELDPSYLAEPDGTVDFDALRIGTFDTADVLFEKVQAQIGAEQATFEGMSMMVHPIDDKMPFENPIDGLMAISVCTVATPDTPPTLDELWGYAGFIAYVDAPEGALSLKLPASAPEIEVRLREFGAGGFLGEHRVAARGGEDIRFGGNRLPYLPVVLLVLAAGILWTQRQRVFRDARA